MKKIDFLISLVLFIIGDICLFITSILDKSMPILGKMASQLSDTKIYDGLMYQADYKIAYGISFVMLFLGIILTLYFYRSEPHDKKET